MDQRTQFIADYLRESLSIVDLCALYGVSRKTGYKWIDRYLRFGPAGLDERSRKPRASPNQTGQDIVMALRCSICNYHSGKVVGAVGLVGATGRDVRTHWTRQAAAKRLARAYAPHIKKRDHAAAGRKPVRPAAQVQLLSRRVQK